MMKKSVLLSTIKEILIEAIEGLTSKNEIYEPEVPLLYKNVYEPKPVIYYVDNKKYIKK